LKKLGQAHPDGEQELEEDSYEPDHLAWIPEVQIVLQQTPAKVYELSCKRVDRSLLSRGTIKM
jgi:hypothetical protein